MEKHPHYQISLSAAELHREGKFHYVRRSSSVARSLLGMNRVCHQALVYRRQVFERLGLYREEYKLAADYEHHLRAELAGLPTVILPEILVQYDLGGRSDNYDRVFAEFRGIHASLEKERSLGAQCLHLLVMYLEWFRVAIFKKLGKTQWAKPLKALWLAWQRRNERDLG